MVQEHRKNDLVKRRSTSANFTDDDIPEISQEELAAIYEYNSSLANIDSEYASVQPMSKVLVRVFLLEPHKTENGLLEPHTQLLPVPTNSGYGSVMQIESPFPYSNKAIVIATPPTFSMIKVGDIVQLESNPVKPIVTGSGANASVHVPYAYMHPSANTIEIPTSCTNKHYGYLLIPFHEIATKIA